MDDDRFERGMRTRREILGSRHVDKALAETTELTAAFQELITRYAWGEVWSRPGLNRRTRSLITIALLTAVGAERELEMHIRAAIRNGASTVEIRETLLHAAIYAGLPAANRAFDIAHSLLSAADEPADAPPDGPPDGATRAKA